MRISKGSRWMRMRPGRRYALCVAMLLAVAAAPGRAARVADTQPADEPEAGQPKGPFHLSYFDGDLQFESMQDWRRVTTPTRNVYALGGTSGGRQTDRQARLEETMGLRFAGDVLYPEFINFNADLRLGLDQLWAHENSSWLGREEDNDNGWLAEYNVNAQFFAKKPVNFDLYALHTNERISREFLPNLNHEQWKYGTNIRYQNEKFPMELTLETSHDKYTGTSDLSDLYDNEDTREALIRYNGTLNVSQYHQLQISAEHSRINDQYSGSAYTFRTTRNILNLDDRIEFGSEKQHVFETILEYEEDRGDLSRDHLDVGPQLTLNHSEAFSTRYKYQYTRDNYDNLLLQNHRWDFEPTLRLTPDLTFTGDTYIAHESSDEEMTGNDYGGLLRADYRRKNAWGTFTAGAGYHYDNDRVDYDTRYGVVVDEAGFLQDPLPWILAKPHVVPGTIVVTNLTRTQVFVLGRDYSLLVIGDHMGLRRIPYGRINNKDSVLICYLYETSQKATYNTHEFDARIQQDFTSGWTPYYTFNVRRQSVDSEGFVAAEPNNLNRHRIGLNYRKSRWSAGGEFEFNHETVEPYNALHVNSEWAILNRMPHQLDLRASESHFWFTGDDPHQADLFDVALDYRHPLVRWVDVKAHAAYRYEHDTCEGLTQGVDVASGVQYRIGQLTITCDVEYDKLDTPGTRDDGFSLWIRVRRDFPDLLRLRQ